MKVLKLGVAAAIAGALAVTSLSALAGPKITLEKVVGKVNAPIAMMQPAGDSRMFILEHNGKIRIMENGKINAVPFLDFQSKVVTQIHDFDERGGLGLAFHPKFKENGKFYVAYSTRLAYEGDLGKKFWWDHSNVVEEYTVSKDDPDSADINSARRVLTSDWPQFNHNGHWIGFGPDNMLYISMGDGGYANDWGIGHNVTEGNGQDLTTNLGKILRIDVDGRTDGKAYGIPKDNPFVKNDDANDEIFAYGFRNPWRCSFDTGSGNLFCADVGQNSYEEVDIVVKGGNYGWRKIEGKHCFNYAKPDAHPDSCDTSGTVLPIVEYQNCTAKPESCLGISITGGYVYQGAHAAWKGKYIFGDWSKTFGERHGQFFIAGKAADGKWSMEVAEVSNMKGNLPYVLAFAQGNDGEVYALTSVTTGANGNLDSIYKIVPAK